jgi:hypothetical protein
LGEETPAPVQPRSATTAPTLTRRITTKEHARITAVWRSSANEYSENDSVRVAGSRVGGLRQQREANGRKVGDEAKRDDTD